jgi:hypothetical protein
VTDPIRNPFGALDVPDPNGADVRAFASRQLDVSLNDANAHSWTPSSTTLPAEPSSIEGEWHSRWNGGATGLEWKQGTAEVRVAGAGVFLLFRWSGETQQGLMETRLDGRSRLIGRYMNLGNTSIVRPWVGLIIDHRRIDGYWTEGRLDFRR